MRKTFLIFHFILIGISISVLTASAETFHVRILDDHGAGVESTLYLTDLRKHETRIGETNEQGQIRMEGGCKAGKFIKVVPKSSVHYPTLQRCPIALSTWILVTKKSLFENLKINAEYLEENGQSADAALIYNEMMVRARGFDRDLAIQFRLKVLTSFGKYLGTENMTVHDPVQNREVISPEFKQAIQKFQREKDLLDSGRIDYGTLSAAASHPVSHYLFKDISVQ